MNGFEKLQKFFILDEAILETVHTETSADIVLKIRVSEWNLTSAFFSEWRMPADHAEARKILERLIPGGCLIIYCKNVVRLTLDRIERHGNPSLLLAKPKLLDNCEEAGSAAKTIYGFGFESESPLKNALVKEYANRFLHMVIDTVDARLELIFEELNINNFPAALPKTHD